MDAIQSQIHAALHREAENAPRALDMFSIVERRAACVRTRRRGVAVASLTVLTTLVTVALSGGNGFARGSRPPVGASSPSSHVAATVMTWPVAGDGTAYSWVDLNGARSSLEAQMPPPFAATGTPTVLWSGQTEAGPAVVVAVRSGTRTAVGAVVQALGTSVARGVHEVGETGAQVSVLVDLPQGAGSVDDAIVVASPGRRWTLQIQEASARRWVDVVLSDGRSGVASVGRLGNAVPPQIRLTSDGVTLQATVGEDGSGGGT